MALDGGRISATASLKQALIDQLEMAFDLTGRLDDETYCGVKNGRGSIGAHLRHNLNFVETILDGARSGSIDHASRSRDRRVETERSFAAVAVRSLIEAIVAIPMELDEPMNVTSELDPGIRFRSTLGRELEFAISHTIHHYALIKERLEGTGFEFDPRFGVAPSTLEYWRTDER